MSAPYAPDPTLGTMATADRAKVNADNVALVDAASSVGDGSIRTGTRLRSSKLEFPDHVLVVGDSCGHKHWDWRYTGGGKPIVFDDSPAPVYSYDSEPPLTGVTGNLIPTESQNFINTIAILPVPAWTAVGAAAPLMRLKRLAVSVQLITNETTTDDSTPADPTGASKIYPGDSDLASQLVVRVHRISYGGLRQQLYAPALAGAEGYMDHVSEAVDAWKSGVRTGLVARARSKSFTDNVPAITLHPNAAGGAPGGKAYGTFCATALLAGDALSQRQNLAAGDAILVSITGPSHVIYAGLETFDPTKRNIILPVRGSWVVAVFGGGHAA